MKKYFITAGVILVLLINLIILYILLKAKVETNQPKFEYTPLSEEQKAHVYVDGTAMLSRTYGGEVDTNYIIEKIENLPNGKIVELYNDVKDLNDNEISEYLKKNKTTIESNFGISDITNFKKLVNCVLPLKNSSQKCISSLVNLDNYTTKNGYAVFELKVNYENNITLNFNVQVSLSRKSTTALVKFIPAN